jgi:tight adherence protein C
MLFLLLVILALGAAMCAFALLTYEWLCLREKSRIQIGAKRRLGVLGKGAQVEKGFAALLAHTPLAAPLKRRADERLRASFERDLPALLEVIALGMQAGMGFDQAFALYTERFSTPLAQCCKDSLEVWHKGLRNRDEGMRQLAERVGTSSFRQFSSSALRALRFGAPMTQLLLDLAEEARKEYRAKRQELVAKAPVKMLLPTGALILPAMLLLVMGPIMLDLMRKMG